MYCHNVSANLKAENKQWLEAFASIHNYSLSRAVDELVELARKAEPMQAQVQNVQRNKDKAVEFLANVPSIATLNRGGAK